MKNIKSKKLLKAVNTVCDFNSPLSSNNWGTTEPPTGTDPTNTTIITLTTVSSHIISPKQPLV